MPRAIISGQFSDNQIVADLEPQFSQYPANKLEFLLGAASSLDANSNSFTVTLNKGGQKVVKYNRLIIATGSSAKDGMPWKLGASAGITLDSLHELQDKIRKAQTVVVAGGGLTGAEMAGELGFEYASQSKKEVIFIYNDMISKTHVTDVTTEGANTIIKVRGSDGEMSSVLAQTYIPSLGLSPNTAFAPASMRNANGYLKQMTTLQIEGHPNIFVATHFIKNLSTILSGGQMLEYSASSRKFYGFTLDRSRAIGQMGNCKLFSLLV
ncbi:pyridine nucleotide-disulfide oxidoreductase domain-containing protein [Trichoderma breve]|uniref:Pyridine nucleotide-disulfide oxidoreductase domain-containing protein n=1 Tax=Trichoderma breve TaxID=2034170 RepID=A0A9W9JPN6_9HYPO|nr:pyridine nucleotide-disulfide oxidoreductase domain-containing protein [Trichoderma breve]KAJ4863488.1 pyridine nucleotide-disulfide oxidoreductase domain-containing protein [Trichoderma breve]